MGETCERCHRPIVVSSPDLGHCHGVPSAACFIAAAAYQRGRLDGIAHAKATATATAYPDGVAEIDWTETDRDEGGET